MSYDNFGSGNINKRAGNEKENSMQVTATVNGNATLKSLLGRKGLSKVPTDHSKNLLSSKSTNKSYGTTPVVTRVPIQNFSPEQLRVYEAALAGESIFFTGWFVYYSKYMCM